jgi:HSP20 family protein
LKGDNSVMPPLRSEMSDTSVISQEQRSNVEEYRRQLLASFTAIPACQRHDSEIDWFPAVDLLENHREYVLYADLPGLDSDTVKVAVENGVLSITGSRNTPSEGGDFRRIERPRGRFIRLIALPDDARPSEIQVAFHQGTLTVRVARGSTNGEGGKDNVSSKVGGANSPPSYESERQP